MQFIKIIFKILFKVLLPLAVLAGGAAITIYLIKTKPTAAKKQIENPPTLVEVIIAKSTNEKIIISTNGSVKPAQQIELRPEVSGRIVYQNPNLVPGGRLTKGDVMVRIDPRDYQYALERQKALLEEARFRLTEEEGRKAIAEREWKLLGSQVETTEAGRSLALRIPHLQKAQASLSGASSSLDEAKLDLQRTTISAPFNAIIQTEFVDPGQVLNPQSTIATLIGTDQYWVQVSVHVKDLPWIPLPNQDGSQGAEVYVTRNLGQGKSVEWRGRVVRLLSGLETTGRMARLLVAIDDPLNLKAESAEDLMPLLLDDYVRVKIEGKMMNDVISIPWKALREGDKVWIIDQNNQLEIRRIEVLRSYEDQVIIQGDIKDGESIITNNISTPIPGTILQTVSQDIKSAISTPPQSSDGSAANEENK